MNKDFFPNGNRFRVEDFLEDGEEQDLKYDNNVPVFYRGELTMMIGDNEETSSLSDDGIPESELELFSSDFQETDAGDYIPPLTKTKKNLIKYLVQNTINKFDDDAKKRTKQKRRCKLLRIYRNNILKKRAVKAYRRLLKADEMGCNSPEQKAFCLEKMEIKDKKLNRPFYFEHLEPSVYKKLLKKRKRAIRRKYELFALDANFRNRYKCRVLGNIGNIKSMQDEELSESVECNEQLSEKDEYEDGSVETTTSSMYDLEIPQSELEYFSSDFNDEPDIPYLGHKSNTLAKLKRHLKRCRVTRHDDNKAIRDKMLNRAEINAQFKNYVEAKRATKALARLQTAHSLNCADSDELTKHLYDMEILDKKLHHSYYYDPNEPEVYKILLGKRRRAVARKYERFKCDQKFQSELEERIYSNYMRTQSAPLFEDPDAESDGDDSSFNDSEIPTSEEEFMSCENLVLPNNYKKPLTRTKEILYEELENFEPNMGDTTSTINLKRRMRLETLNKYKQEFIQRRKEKALARIETGFKVSQDPGVQANYLMSTEISDKKLDRGFYYRKSEPQEYKTLLDMRLRAIHRKYELFVADHHFRNNMRKRILKGAKHPKSSKPKYNNSMEEKERFKYDDEGYSPDDESENLHAREKCEKYDQKCPMSKYRNFRF